MKSLLVSAILVGALACPVAYAHDSVEPAPGHEAVETVKHAHKKHHHKKPSKKKHGKKCHHHKKHHSHPHKHSVKKVVESETRAEKQIDKETELNNR